MGRRIEEQTRAEAAASLCRIAIATVAVGTFRGEITQEHLNADRGWSDGPLPLSLVSPFRSQVTADRLGRQTYHESHLQKLVLGTSTGSWRVHRFLTEAVHPRPGVRIWAVEAIGLNMVSLLGPPSARSPLSAVVVHGTVDPAGMSLADVHRAMETVDPSALDDLHRVGTIDSPHRRGEQERFRLALITKRDGAFPHLDLHEQVHDRLRHWAHAFASRTLPRGHFEAATFQATRRPDFDADDEYLLQAFPDGAWFAPSADWRLGVLQSGAAFIGLRADTAQRSLWQAGLTEQSGGEFFDFAELYVRSIYTDAVLLGMGQRHALASLADAARTLAREARPDLRRLEHLEIEWARFRETVWSARASGGGVSDNLLNAYHLQHQVPEQMEQIDQNIESVSRRARLSIETGKAGALALLSILGVMGLIFTVVRAFATPPQSSTAGGDVGSLLATLVIFAVVVVLLLRVFPGLATVISAAARQEQRRR